MITTHQGRRFRRALAPLEFVMALPLLLLIMALMVNYGTVACWKVRGLTIARHQLWGNSPLHSLDNFPRPDFWPTTGTMNSGGLGNLSISTGPTLPCATYSSAFDTSSGPRQGTAGLNRAFPMMGKYWSYSLNASTMFLDNDWQWWHKSWNDPIYKTWPMTYLQAVHWGNGPYNYDIRIPIIMALPWAPGAPDNTSVSNANEWNDPWLKSLNQRDPEDLAYRIRFLGLWKGLQNFHPPFRNFCSVDHDFVDTRVEQYVGQVKNVPSTMSRSFSGMYNFVINQLMVNPKINQAEINTLQQLVSWLKNFP